MLYHASTLGQLRHAVNSFIERLGEDAPVGSGVGCLEGDVMLNRVVIDGDGTIVGYYSDGCRPGPGQREAVRVE